jgi:hypothetical protein
MMDVRDKTHWVVPFLDDVAIFLSEHGMPESSGIVAEASARVQISSALEAGLDAIGNGCENDRVVRFRPKPGRC